jgi:hypothetical protein
MQKPSEPIGSGGSLPGRRRHSSRAMDADRHIFDPNEPDHGQPIRSDVHVLLLDGTGKCSNRLTHVTSFVPRSLRAGEIAGCAQPHFMSC